MIPTAEAFFKHTTNTNFKKDAIEFAKLHVQAALKAAAESAIVSDGGFPCQVQHYSIDTQSITDAYPLDNIK